jgi:PAS domain S-box-containing protein
MSDIGRERLWTHARLLMLTASFEGEILAVNPAWTTILGWPVDEIVGGNFFDLLHPDDRERTVAEAAALMGEGHQVPRFENRYRTRDGDYRDIDWTAVSDGRFIHALGRENTDDKDRAGALAVAQDGMRQAQKMEAIGQLTGGVAHDFNNLLTIIRSSVDFLQRPELSEERRQRYVGAISDTVDRAAKLTSQLLAFARRQPLNPEVFDVGEKVAAVAELVRTVVGGRITINLVAPKGITFVKADLGQFETALVNLAVNARDAMNGEGRLIITVESVDAIPPIRAHLRRPGRFVAVRVRDLGLGIPPDKLEAIFEPFYTTKEVGKGTGLGLSQVFGFTKPSNGEVGVESTLGEGASFTLYLPSVGSDTLLAGGGPAPRLQGASVDGVCVLIVEDNEAVGQFSTEMLHDLGYRTRWAASAAEALDILGSDAAGFDLVFSDVIMPGMNGVDFAHVVRDRFRTLPVVLTSGYSDVLVTQGHAGFELIQKPYSVESLSRILQSALRTSKTLVDN